MTVQNHQNQKPEGTLVPFSDGALPQVKICKFLKGHNCLVSADTDGYLNFYAVVPSPFKNQLLARKIYYNEREQIMAMHEKHRGGNKPKEGQNSSDDDEPVFRRIEG